MRLKSYVPITESMVKDNEHHISLVFSEEDGTPRDISSWDGINVKISKSASAQAALEYNLGTDPDNVSLWSEDGQTVNAILVTIQEGDSDSLEPGKYQVQMTRTIAEDQTWTFARGTLTVTAAL